MRIKIPEKLASRIGVDRSYIKKINRGIRRPSLKTARKIIEAMEGLISLEDLRPDIVNQVYELTTSDKKMDYPVPESLRSIREPEK
jgi:DNA-binding transcriptional regulator YdaS (Cro superfamily)